MWTIQIDPADFAKTIDNLLQFIELQKTELFFVCLFEDLADALGCFLELVVGECTAVKAFFEPGFFGSEGFEILLELFQFLLLLVCQLAFLGTAIPRHPA